MKFVKKITALFLALTMVMAMGINVCAANITITGGGTGSTYAAYKLLNATTDGSGDSLVISYTLNDKYTSILESVTGKTTQADILSYIEAQTGDNTRTFADAVYKQIVSVRLEADYTTTINKFEGVDKGYYLIAETATGSDTTYSLVMLNTAAEDNVDVNTKEDKPTFEKKVMDVNDTTDVKTGWQDSADYDIGDSVPFKLTGTVANNMTSYKGAYYFAFHDQLEAGKFDTFESGNYYNNVKVYIGDEKTGTEIDSQYYSVSTSDGHSLDVIFKNLKDVPNVTNGSVITVTFDAKLGTGANIGSEGNENQAKLEYSNNPYDEQEGEEKPDTEETPWDIVIVFTYKVVVDKYANSVADDNKLAGAEFTLTKTLSDGSTKVISAVKSDNNTKFTFSGLDDGTYTLTETTTPPGYTTISPITFTVTAEHKVEWNADVKTRTDMLTSLSGNVTTGDITLTPDTSAGSLSTNVVNKSGSILPSTGGMGTTVLYIAGIAMIVVAGVVVIARKRNA